MRFHSKGSESRCRDQVKLSSTWVTPAQATLLYDSGVSLSFLSSPPPPSTWKNFSKLIMFFPLQRDEKCISFTPREREESEKKYSSLCVRLLRIYLSCPLLVELQVSNNLWERVGLSWQRKSLGMSNKLGGWDRRVRGWMAKIKFFFYFSMFFACFSIFFILFACLSALFFLHWFRVVVLFVSLLWHVVVVSTLLAFCVVCLGHTSWAEHRPLSRRFRHPMGNPLFNYFSQVQKKSCVMFWYRDLKVHWSVQVDFTVCWDSTNSSRSLLFPQPQRSLLLPLFSPCCCGSETDCSVFNHLSTHTKVETEKFGWENPSSTTTWR